MNAVTGFVLGLLVGWVIEWIIDWVYWRRRMAEMAGRLELVEARLAKEPGPKMPEGLIADYEARLIRLKADNKDLEEKIVSLEAQKAALQTPAATLVGTAAGPQEKAAEIPAAAPLAADATLPGRSPAPVIPDDLIVIKGIGPVISKKLNDAGIYTFRELAAITPGRLREIVGDVIQRLADEDDIIDQAKKLAAEKEQQEKS